MWIDYQAGFGKQDNPVSYTQLDVYKRQTRDSVFENIRMGSNASLDEVRAAAKEAQIDDFIMSLPCLLYTSRCV